MNINNNTIYIIKYTKTTKFSTRIWQTEVNLAEFKFRTLWGFEGSVLRESEWKSVKIADKKPNGQELSLVDKQELFVAKIDNLLKTKSTEGYVKSTSTTCGPSEEFRTNRSATSIIKSWGF